MLREKALHTHIGTARVTHVFFFFLSSPTDRQTGGDCPALFPYVLAALLLIARPKIHSNQSRQDPSPGSLSTITKYSSSPIRHTHSLPFLFFLIVFILQAYDSSLLTNRHIINGVQKSAGSQAKLTKRAHVSLDFFAEPVLQDSNNKMFFLLFTPVLIAKS